MKLLVANRGEIACRIFETCRLMGITPVAIYASDEKSARHVTLADEAYELAGSTLKETYLNQKQLIDIAKKANIDLIHPGYGFLSENAEFAALVVKNKIRWIGAPAKAIEAMGSKIASKILAEKVKVPTLGWKYFKDTEIKNADWISEANRIGYPLLVKASGGGGGRGMRLIHKAEDVLQNIELAMNEAQAAFGNASIFLEKYLGESRHIEVQILADSKGKVTVLSDRECSVQRRHQKIIEEAPAPRINDKTRKNLHASAAKLAEELDYRGAGTLEFLLDEDQNYYFLEMNTRLQVEHPVTEWITGTDLVAEQIRVALDQPVSFDEHPVITRGHSIECRIYAEDPYNNFLPSPGPVTVLKWPTLKGVRIDTGIIEGQNIAANYDPMIAKLSVYAQTRKEATELMKEALSQTTLLGSIHNIFFLKRILESRDFADSKVYTNTVEKKIKEYQLNLDQILPDIIPLLFKTSSPKVAGSTQSKRGNLFSEIKL